MSMMIGTKLHPEDQKHVLAAYVHRYTGDHRPNWVNDDTPLHFKDDKDWLANSSFRVTKAGRLDGRCRSCYSNPTWPSKKA